MPPYTRVHTPTLRQGTAQPSQWCMRGVQNHTNFGTRFTPNFGTRFTPNFGPPITLHFQIDVEVQLEVVGAKSQGAKLSMDKLREIIRLHELGRNQSEIARSCNIARATVQPTFRR